MSTHQEDLIQGFKILLFLAIAINGAFWFFGEIAKRAYEDQNYRYQRCVEFQIDPKQCYRKIIDRYTE